MDADRETRRYVLALHGPFDSDDDAEAFGLIASATAPSVVAVAAIALAYLPALFGG